MDQLTTSFFLLLAQCCALAHGYGDNNDYGGGGGDYGGYDYGRPEQKDLPTYIYKPMPLPSWASSSPAYGFGQAHGEFNPGVFRPVFHDQYQALKIGFDTNRSPVVISHLRYVPRLPPPVYGDLGALTQNPIITEEFSTNSTDTTSNDDDTDDDTGNYNSDESGYGGSSNSYNQNSGDDDSSYGNSHYNNNSTVDDEEMFNSTSAPMNVSTTTTTTTTMRTTTTTSRSPYESYLQNEDNNEFGDDLPAYAQSSSSSSRNRRRRPYHSNYEDEDDQSENNNSVEPTSSRPSSTSSPSTTTSTTTTTTTQAPDNSSTPYPYQQHRRRSHPRRRSKHPHFQRRQNIIVEDTNSEQTQEASEENSKIDRVPPHGFGAPNPDYAGFSHLKNIVEAPIVKNQQQQQLNNNLQVIVDNVGQQSENSDKIDRIPPRGFGAQISQNDGQQHQNDDILEGRNQLQLLAKKIHNRRRRIMKTKLYQEEQHEQHQHQQNQQPETSAIKFIALAPPKPTNFNEESRGDDIVNSRRFGPFGYIRQRQHHSSATPPEEKHQVVVEHQHHQPQQVVLATLLAEVPQKTTLAPSVTTSTPVTSTTPTPETTTPVTDSSTIVTTTELSSRPQVAMAGANVRKNHIHQIKKPQIHRQLNETNQNQRHLQNDQSKKSLQNNQPHGGDNEYYVLEHPQPHEDLVGEQGGAPPQEKQIEFQDKFQISIRDENNPDQAALDLEVHPGAQLTIQLNTNASSSSETETTTGTPASTTTESPSAHHIVEITPASVPLVPARPDHLLNFLLSRQEFASATTTTTETSTSTESTVSITIDNNTVKNTTDQNNTASSSTTIVVRPTLSSRMFLPNSLNKPQDSASVENSKRRRYKNKKAKNSKSHHYLETKNKVVALGSDPVLESYFQNIQAPSFPVKNDVMPSSLIASDSNNHASSNKHEQQESKPDNVQISLRRPPTNRLIDFS